MASPKKLPALKPRNVMVRAMMKRYGQTTTVMKDRRKPRGGSKNKVSEFLSGDY